MPKTLNVDAPSSKIDWEAGKVELLTEAREWEANGRPRRAGISAFGMSGTNAHLILEEGPVAGRDPGPGTSSKDRNREGLALPVGPAPLLLSARGSEALAALAARLAAHIEENPELELGDLARALATTRAQHGHRAGVVAAEREGALAGLLALAAGESHPAVLTGSAHQKRSPVLLFPGQGSQWVGMGIELAGSSPVFAAALAECEEALAPHLDFNLRDAIAGSEGAPSLERVEVVQPALFALMVSLARLWQACGVRPAAVVGHSQGEIAAAHIAGGLSLEDAARLAAVRAKLIAKIAGRGGMVSVIAPRVRVEGLIEPWGGEIEIAAYNGPSATLVSGAGEALSGLLAACSELEDVSAREVAVDYASHSRHVEVLREEILDSLAGISPRTGEIPFHSTVSGGPLDTAELDAEYWYRNLRQPVRFEQVTEGLLASDRRALIEVSPHPVLALALNEMIDQVAPEGASVIETLRREEGTERFLSSLLAAHASGTPVDWDAFFKDAGPSVVSLPTYPFQRKRYWSTSARGGTDLSAIGQMPLSHPFLAAAIEEPDGGGLSLSGRISLAEHSWLEDHAVAGATIVPGTVFLELALRAGREVGAGAVEELTLSAPLALTDAPVALRVSLSAPEQGRREIAIHSRPEEEGARWTKNAAGALADDARFEAEPLGEWPPRGAEQVELTYLRARLAEAGFEYGEAFQGLSGAWRRGTEIYAEASLPTLPRDGFVAHPALLDAALHPLALGAEQELRLLFSVSGVSLPDGLGSEVRVRIRGDERDARIELFDELGKPLGGIESGVIRPFDPAQLATGEADPLYELTWQAASAEDGEPRSRTEIEDLRKGGGSAQELCVRALGRIQSFLAEEAEDARLAFLVEGASSAAPGEPRDPGAAAVAGLVGSAASEHPGRFCLIDTDGSEASEAALEIALASPEPQLALREGQLLAPRLVESAEPDEAGPVELDPERTVLITGASGGLGSLIARHLVETHGARHLLLASRSGEEAAGAKELREELDALGATVRIVACDVSERERVAALLDGINAEHPLGAVIHCAAVLDDATVQAANAAQIERVFAPKAGGAQHLDELTRELGLSHFVCFSAAAGLLGSSGLGAYAAANCFLDGLVARRRVAGLAGTSIAWGPWQPESGMAADLSEADLARFGRSALALLSAERGLALFDRALLGSGGLVAAIGFDRGELRARAAAGTLPPLLTGLAPARPLAAASSPPATRITGLSEPERERKLAELVRGEAAAVLGHDSAAEVAPDRAFKDLGFDSLAAVELRNRLNEATGLRLASTAVFDYPTPAALTSHLLAQTGGASAPASGTAARARASEEPIAIVGMACRLPGGADSPQGLWEMLAAGRDAIGPLPTDRGWDPESVYTDTPDSPEYLREGGFLAGAAEFDPAFFGISPREATAMDPQQRLALESSWEALEDAGIDPLGLQGSETGVFTGVSDSDYGVSVADASNASASVTSGRVSYALGLEGPAISVDTACSSSLVAIHLAANALQRGECDLALAGGVAVLVTPMVFGYFSNQQGLARDGRSKSFAESADGAGFSEGAGVLVLERLSDAEAKGHHILATIRGSAVNQDGASNGLTAPNGPSQERVIRQALANAGLEPADIDMVEAHGTGTSLGDPIEAGALLATYGRDREQPLMLGSLKSNVGHAQAAAGVSGVIKAVLAMREGTMPKTLHVDQPSSKIDWETGRVELLTEAREWEANGRPRRAGVSSFGISGTNAHLILEEGPVAGRDPGPGASSKDLDGESSFPAGPLPLLISAKEEALAEQAARLGAHIEQHPELSLADLAYSLATTRPGLQRRAVLLAEDREELVEGLGALARGERPPNAALAKASTSPSLAYLFTGQGSQRPGMGQELSETYPAYREALDQVFTEIDPLIDRSLAALIFSEEGSSEATDLSHTTYAQPALFATQVALGRLYESWGLAPEAMAATRLGRSAPPTSPACSR